MNNCPGCGSPLEAGVARCSACGQRLTTPRVAFDLSDDPLPMTEAEVRKRLLGATLPFLLSLVWVAILWAGEVTGRFSQLTVATGSLLAFPILRLLLPFIGWKALEQKQPVIAGGFRNALFTVWQLVLAHLAIGIIGVPTLILLSILGFLTACFSGSMSLLAGIDVTKMTPFQTTPGMAAATLLVQGMLAGILPVTVLREQGRLRISKANGKQVFLAMVLLGAAWWLPGPGNTLVLTASNALVTYLALKTVQESRALTPPSRTPLRVLILMSAVLALALTFVQSGTVAG